MHGHCIKQITYDLQYITCIFLRVNMWDVPTKTGPYRLCCHNKENNDRQNNDCLGCWGIGEIRYIQNHLETLVRREGTHNLLCVGLHIGWVWRSHPVCTRTQCNATNGFIPSRSEFKMVLFLSCTICII